MFFGVFLMLAGLMALAEALGLVTADMKWGMPLVVVCFGASLVWDSLKKGKTPEN